MMFQAIVLAVSQGPAGETEFEGPTLCISYPRSKREVGLPLQRQAVLPAVTDPASCSQASEI